MLATIFGHSVRLCSFTPGKAWQPAQRLTKAERPLFSTARSIC